MKIVAIVFFSVIGLISCGEKKDSPFCFSCEKGNIYFSRGIEHCPVFVKDNGDSVYLQTSIDKKFHKEGIRVCIKTKKNKGATNCLCQTYFVQCIKEIN